MDNFRPWMLSGFDTYRPQPRGRQITALLEFGFSLGVGVLAVPMIKTSLDGE